MSYGVRTRKREKGLFWKWLVDQKVKDESMRANHKSSQTQRKELQFCRPLCKGRREKKAQFVLDLWRKKIQHSTTQSCQMFELSC